MTRLFLLSTQLNQFEMFVSSLKHESKIENCLFDKGKNVVLNGEKC